MKTARSWLAGMVGAAVFVSTLASAQSDQSSTAKAKTPSKSPAASTGSKASGSSTVHRSSKSPSGKPHSSSSRTASTRSTSRKGKRISKTSWRRGQQKVDAARAKQIQQALIREHYLSGAASGSWDATTEDAMRRYQGDNGWQNKTVPDSRALIKLGLGPSHDHLLNPESAMITTPEPPRTTGAPGMPSPATPPGTANQTRQ